MAQPSLYEHVDGIDGVNRPLAILALFEVGATIDRVLHGFVSLELGGGFGLPQSADTSLRRLVHATTGRSAIGDHAIRMID